jgi:hypothetical protein
MARRTWKAQTLFAVVALCLAAGCGSRPRVVEVEGIVKLGSKPLPHLRIQFMPDPEKGTVGPISTGTTDDTGHFKLTCADERAGAVVGWHRVVITDLRVHLPRETRQGRRDDDKEGASKQRSLPSRVPEKYTTSGKTPLTLEVQGENKDVTIELSR